ncbi:MAG TPA: trypsin-like peptidase domain-containing protein [Vicinamibacterales bacterium]|nr:trypsin-like peptidase domain-containing protein [Vicinamibacterales bacterium]
MVRRLIAGLVLLAAGFISGLLLTARLHISNDFQAEEVTAARDTASRATSAAASPAASAAPAAVSTTSVAAPGPDFTHIAGQAVKGVANISSLQVVRTPNSPFAADPFFRYFFGDGDDVFGSRDRRSLSLGSGVMISSDGYIVTNNHVVGENMREIRVTLPNKREVTGRLVGTDPATDIALLRLQVKDLPAIPWGDSSKLQIGEWVLAIGSPFQLSATVTAGIVSATGRTNVGFADYEDFIQTDAAINPGNSGGALINARGELVGINTGIFTQSGGYQGIGFAVPSQLVRRVVDDLMKYGEVRRGSVDFRVENMTFEEEPPGGSGHGALVSQMYRNSASYDAGLRPGDMIVSVNGKTVEDASQFRRMVADSKIGTVATLKIMRSGRSADVRVPIESSSSTASRRRR